MSTSFQILNGIGMFVSGAIGSGSISTLSDTSVVGKWEVDPDDASSIQFRIPSASFGGSNDRIGLYFSGSGKVGVGTKDPETAFDVRDFGEDVDPKDRTAKTKILKISKTTQTFDTPVTASIVSASGDIITSTINNPNGLTFKVNTGNSFDFQKSPFSPAVTIHAEGHITASGNISASGNFIGHRQFDLPGATGTTQGDIVFFGSAGPDFDEGKLHYLRSNSTWNLADKDSGSTAGQVLLAFALGAAPSDGMLLRGMFRYGSDLGTIGDEIYVGDSGVPTNDVSGFASDDIIRIIGYLLESTNGTIWFNPDNTFIKKA